MNNSVTLIGHIGQDPRSKTFADTGNKVVKFSLAVKEYSPNSDVQKTLWLDVDSWNGLADRVEKTITKGREVVIYGRLSISTFSRDVEGVTVQTSKPVIKLSSFHLCGRKPDSSREDDTESNKPSSKKKRLTAVKG